ncbi:hypothetical protein HDU96_008217 [Phlyctochytrium bullatum]|nr:hypothetical protein HDU96_008217 [Phlyctochytrium bullatum]
MPCCEKAKWKREEIADHKFDYIDVNDFIEDSPWRKIAYMGVFLLTLKSFIVYMNDLLIASLMFQSLSSGRACDNTTFSLSACNNDPTLNQVLRKEIRPYLILASVVISFVLLFIDWRKAQIIIKSRDISYSFTSTIAYRYYVLRSYAHYCFFCQIQNSRRTIDVLAFFVFFQFKGWKRLVFAEFPRQFIIAVNLADFLITFKKKSDKSQSIEQLLVDFLTSSTTETAQKLLLYLSILSILIFAVSFLSLIASFFIYIPLLCVIRGNLKEYCCHKIDKRIGELLKKKSNKRKEEARRAELAEIERANLLRKRGKNDPGGNPASDGAYSESGHGSGPGGERVVAAPLGLTQRPTLPDIDVDLDAPMMKASSTLNGPTAGGPGGYYPPGAGGPGYGMPPGGPYGMPGRLAPPHNPYGPPPTTPPQGPFSDTSSDVGGSQVGVGYRGAVVPPPVRGPPPPGMYPPQGPPGGPGGGPTRGWTMASSAAGSAVGGPGGPGGGYQPGPPPGPAGGNQGYPYGLPPSNASSYSSPSTQRSAGSAGSGAPPPSVVGGAYPSGRGRPSSPPPPVRHGPPVAGGAQGAQQTQRYGAGGAGYGGGGYYGGSGAASDVDGASDIGSNYGRQGQGQGQARGGYGGRGY